MAVKICPKCRASMEPGFVLDRNRFDDRQSTWVEGSLKSNIWTGSVKASERVQIQVTTYRCTGCGYLESYATPEVG